MQTWNQIQNVLPKTKTNTQTSHKRNMNPYTFVHKNIVHHRPRDENEKKKVQPLKQNQNAPSNNPNVILYTDFQKKKCIIDHGIKTKIIKNVNFTKTKTNPQISHKLNRNPCTTVHKNIMHHRPWDENEKKCNL